METVINSKEYIIEAFFMLLKTKKMEDISISDICAKAGVSRVTFYRNFKDKYDVINGYFMMMIKKFVLEMGTRAHHDNYYDIAYHTFYTLKKEKDTMQALIDNNLSYMYQDLLNKYLTKNFLDSNLGTPLTAHLFAGALYNVSIYWVKNDCKENIDDIIKEFFKICNFN